MIPRRVLPFILGFYSVSGGCAILWHARCPPFNPESVPRGSWTLTAASDELSDPEFYKMLDTEAVTVTVDSQEVILSFTDGTGDYHEIPYAFDEPNTGPIRPVEAE